MVDVHNRRCETDGCETFSSYNFPGEKKKRYCSQHKVDGMVIIKRGSAASGQVGSSMGAINSVDDINVSSHNV
jgi:hypothetical protein